VSDVWQGPGYWLASDGKWYAPELHPDRPSAEPQISEARPTDWRDQEPGRGAWEGLSHLSYAPQQAETRWGPYGAVTLEEPRGPSGPGGDAFAMGPKPSGPRGRINRHVLRWGSVAVVALIVGVALLTTVSGPSPTWDPRVLGIVHFDEQHRGLTFKQPVKVEFLGSAQFNKEVSVPQPTSKADRAAESLAVRELRALGLVHGNPNLAASENSLNQSDVVGLYVDDKKTVFVRGTALTPYVRITLAHELTHALQDQYFDLTKLRTGAAGGDDTAVTALIEGDAVRDQTLYEASLSTADQQTYQNEQNQVQGTAAQTANVPEILSDMQEFPYAFGPTYVDALVAKGGTAAIDRAFRDPPVSEAQITDPEQYPVGWKPVHVATPALRAGERRLDKPGPFGQVSLFEVLGSRLGYDQAWTAVQGWQGDNSAPYRDHGRTCMAIDVAMVGTTPAATLADAARAWSRSIPGATVAQDGKTVDIRACDPGAAAPGPPTITPSAFDVLSARSGIIDDLMTGNKVDFAMGKCIADKVLVGVGPSGYGELLSNNLSAAQETQLQQLGAASVGSCQAEGVT
jgi:hypothetical protein